jgi:hypothetical protein
LSKGQDDIQPPIGAPGALQHGVAATKTQSAISGSYLYVAVCCGVRNEGGVIVYDPGATKPERRILEGVYYPITIAVDGKGTLYVLNQSPDGPQGVSVTEFDRGSRGLHE